MTTMQGQKSWGTGISGPVSVYGMDAVLVTELPISTPQEALDIACSGHS